MSEAVANSNCAVSVVVPLYNAEKFLGECLDSLLRQTFQNFEVIVVDDCSTDSSCAVVERYAKNFGGRLKLTHLEKNSGSGAVPRNKGLILSRGEYIFFLDADDFLTATALEEMYALAKNFDADVVYLEKYYTVNFAAKEIQLATHQKGALVDRPTLETGNLAERVQQILAGRFWVTPWCKLTRRDLMIEHEIFFPRTCIGEDDIWTFGLIFHAKKFLRAPNAVYVWRVNEESVGRRKRTPEQNVTFHTNPIVLGLKALDNLMDGSEFFKKNPSCRYAVLEYFMAGNLLAPYEDSWQMPPSAIYEAIKKEFGAALGEQDVLVAALCTYAMTLQKVNHLNVQKFNQLAKNFVGNGS